MIPETELIVGAKGYTQQGREARMTELLAEMHKKHGSFNENCLTLIYIREFRLNGELSRGRPPEVREYDYLSFLHINGSLNPSTISL